MNTIEYNLDNTFDVFSVNQLTGFFMVGNIKIKWNNAIEHNVDNPVNFSIMWKLVNKFGKLISLLVSIWWERELTQSNTILITSS